MPTERDPCRRIRGIDLQAAILEVMPCLMPRGDDGSPLHLDEGSDEEDGSDEEHVEATPAPRSSAKKAKPKTTPASSKAASRPARLPSTALAQPQNPAPPPT